VFKDVSNDTWMFASTAIVFAWITAEKVRSDSFPDQITVPIAIVSGLIAAFSTIQAYKCYVKDKRN
jgi:hypothetical protein